MSCLKYMCTCRFQQIVNMYTVNEHKNKMLISLELCVHVICVLQVSKENQSLYHCEDFHPFRKVFFRCERLAPANTSERTLG